MKKWIWQLLPPFLRNLLSRAAASPYDKIEKALDGPPPLTRGVAGAYRHYTFDGRALVDGRSVVSLTEDEWTATVSGRGADGNYWDGEITFQTFQSADGARTLIGEGSYAYAGGGRGTLKLTAAAPGEFLVRAIDSQSGGKTVYLWRKLQSPD